MFHADGRTDMTKLRVAFRNLAKVLKNRRTRHFVKTSSQLITKKSEHGYEKCHLCRECLIKTVLFTLLHSRLCDGQLRA
jgi:hypothetical protein